MNGVKLDDITTGDFKGDFGPVPRSAIFGKVFMVYWLLSSVGGLPAPQGRKPARRRLLLSPACVPE